MFIPQQQQQQHTQGRNGDESAFGNSSGPSTDQSPLYPSASRDYATFPSHSDERVYGATSIGGTCDEALFTSPASQFNFVRSWIAQHHHQNDVNSAHNHQSEVGYQPAGGLQTYPPAGHQFGALIDNGAGGFGPVPVAAASTTRFGAFQSPGGVSNATAVSSVGGYSSLFPRWVGIW